MEAQDNEGSPVNFLQFTARVVSPHMESSDVTLRQWSPGRYSGIFPVKGAGNYLIHVMEKNRAGQIVALSIPYSPEHSAHSSNNYLLHKLAEVSHGKYGPRPEEVFSKARTRAYVPRDAWETLLVLALLLFPLDVAIRRVFLPDDWVRKYFRPVQLPHKPVIARSATLNALKSRKKEILEERAALMTKEAVQEPASPPPPFPVLPPAKPAPEVIPSLSQDSLTYLERLKQAKKKALPDDKKHGYTQEHK